MRQCTDSGGSATALSLYWKQVEGASGSNVAHWQLEELHVVDLLCAVVHDALAQRQHLTDKLVLQNSGQSDVTMLQSCAKCKLRANEIFL